LLIVDRQLFRRNSKSRISIYKQLRKQRSSKQENNIKLRRKKRNSFFCLCKEEKRTYKLKILLFKLTIIISLFNLLVITLTICC